jgi:hypothetical protein
MGGAVGCRCVDVVGTVRGVRRLTSGGCARVSRPLLLTPGLRFVAADLAPFAADVMWQAGCDRRRRHLERARQLPDRSNEREDSTSEMSMQVRPRRAGSVRASGLLLSGARGLS